MTDNSGKTPKNHISQSRQLAAIMFSDIVGYTALWDDEEQKAFSILTQNRGLQRLVIEQLND